MSWQKALGALLIALGLIGFLTVADDSRHKGEILGVGSIFLAGVVLLGGETKRVIFRRLAVQWIAFGLLAGAAVGACLDRMPAAMGLGTALGSLMAFVLGRKAR